MLNTKPISNPMITALHVENFRCYRKLDLNDLGRVNVVVGKNGAGKTALFESILIAGGNPHFTLQFRNFRGIPGIPFVATKVGYEALWKDLFYNFSQDQTIKITLEGTAINARVLTIKYCPDAQQVPIVFEQAGDKLGLQTDKSTLIPIVFETKLQDKTYLAKPSIQNAGQIVFEGGQPMPASIAFYPNVNFMEPVSQFSQLSIRNAETRVISSITKLFPHITNISQEMAGYTPALYCSVSGIPDKMPIGLASNGINKLLAILLNISSQPGGVVLIDELENGFYHEVLGKVWESIVEFSSEYDVQLFVSTHSLECLHALKPVLQLDESKFRLHRVEEDFKNNAHVIRTFKGDSFFDALETGVDPR